MICALSFDNLEKVILLTCKAMRDPGARGLSGCRVVAQADRLNFLPTGLEERNGNTS